MRSSLARQALPWPSSATACRSWGLVVPAACRRVLYELARMAEDHQLRDPKWDSTLTAAHRLMDSIYVPHRVQQHRR